MAATNATHREPTAMRGRGVLRFIRELGSGYTSRKGRAMDRKTFNQAVIEEFRANRGKVGGQLKGAPLLLLTTKGARTGRPRVNPLAYTTDGDRYVVIASFAGGPKSPPWYHNLIANPDVEVEVGAERFRATASLVKEPDRTRLYKQMAEAMPVFHEYQKKTERIIPVIALSRKR
jgi:deazaflavin-dependent oxidoreductase (nitroreductase family)